MIVAILEQEPLSLSRVRPDIPAELERVVVKALRKDREQRYQTIKDLELDLKTLKQALDLRACPGRWSRATRVRRRTRKSCDKS